MSRLRAKLTPTLVSHQCCSSALWMQQHWAYFLGVYVSYGVFPQQTLAVFLSLSIGASLSLLFLSLCLFISLTLPFSSFLFTQCTGAIVKHWPESQALRRLRGSGLTDRWISPQAPRTGIVEEAFPSHWDPCGLRIPGFCCNNKASHTAKRKYCSKALHCFNRTFCTYCHILPLYNFFFLFCDLLTLKECN